MALTAKGAKAFLRLVGINVALLLAGVIAIELAFGRWFVDYVVPDHRLIDRTFSYPQTLYEPHSVITFVRDKYGLRTSQHPVASAQLVTVGGSTTAQSFISDGETWQDVIHQNTGIVAANAGVDGMSTQSVLEVVDDWLHKIPELKARYFLHYLGINDAAVAQKATNNVWPRRYSWSRRIRGRSAILQAASRLRDRWRGPEIFHSGHQVASGPRHDFLRVDVDRGDAELYIDRFYKPNLRELIRLHRARDEAVILVTQAPNPAFVKHQDGQILVTRPDVARWAVALDEVNAATRAVCGEYPDQCRLIDVANDLSFEPGDFYDLVHNTPPGARKLGAFLASRLTFVGDGRSRQVP